jgi:GGDEF domain-containing protein
MVSQQAIIRRAIAPELREWVNNRLVSAHIRIVRSMILGTLLNTAVLVLCLYGQIAPVHLALFGTNMLAASLHRLWLAEGIARGRRQKRAEKMMVAFELNSLWLGLTLGIFFTVAIPSVGASGQVLLGICGVAQIASAAYTIRTLPRSATIYVLTQAAGLTVGLLQLQSLGGLGSVAVLLAASALLIQMAHTAHDLFVTRILSDRELSASARTVKLLLNEYEASGSDWLFELDGEGRLAKVTGRFARAAGEPATLLEHRSFLDLFAPGNGRAVLAEAIAERRPVRGELLELASYAGSDAARWWSVSGRPCYESGEDCVAFRGVISDVSNQRLAENRVHHMAHYDALTGLPNRALFNQTLGDLLDGCEDSARAALLLIDVDHFKTVNDMYGHPAGDAFLREIAQRLTATVEASGLGGSQHMVARLGGDEFAVVIAGEDPAGRSADRFARCCDRDRCA